MSDAATTRPSLLIRIRDAQDGVAWSEFVAIYAPLVYGFACKHGLQDADAADLTQEVLRSVAARMDHWEYDPKRGSFRGWLFTVVRDKLRRFLARRKRQCCGTGDSGVQRLLLAQPDPAEDQAALWDQEYRRRVFAWAADQVRHDCQESTWRAFWLTAVEGKPGKEVAAQLGLTVAAVYLAKSRTLARLRERIEDLQEE